MGLKRLPLLPARYTMHLMAKAAVTVSRFWRAKEASTDTAECLGSKFPGPIRRMVPPKHPRFPHALLMSSSNVAKIASSLSNDREIVSS